ASAADTRAAARGRRGALADALPALGRSRAARRTPRAAQHLHPGLVPAVRHRPARARRGARARRRRARARGRAPPRRARAAAHARADRGARERAGRQRLRLLPSRPVARGDRRPVPAELPVTAETFVAGRSSARELPTWIAARRELFAWWAGSRALVLGVALL